MILEKLEKYLSEDSKSKYYNFGFDVAIDDISISEEELYKLSENLSGEIEGYVGVLEDVRSIIIDDTLSVIGKIKLPSDVSYASYNKTPAELSLDIYNEVLKKEFNTFITDVDVEYNKETESFEK